MPATWVDPEKTWATGDKITAAIMNQEVRDRAMYLQDIRQTYDESVLNEGSNFTTTSTSFVDIDATALGLNINVIDSTILVHFHGCISMSAGAGSGQGYLELLFDGVAVAGDDGITVLTFPAVGAAMMMTFTRLITNIDPGNHSIKLQWKVSSGDTLTLFAGAGTSGADVHPQFWVKEL